MAEQKQNAIKTSTLLRRLFKAPNLEAFIDKDLQTIKLPTFNEYITALCKTRNEAPERVINRAGIERTYGHQLFNGTRKPSRDKVLQIAFGFEMNYEETQKLLKKARKSALYPKIKRDAVIIFSLNRKFRIPELQATLLELRLPLLGRDDRYE